MTYVDIESSMMYHFKAEVPKTVEKISERYTTTLPSFSVSLVSYYISRHADINGAAVITKEECDEGEEERGFTSDFTRI